MVTRVCSQVAAPWYSSRGTSCLVGIPGVVSLLRALSWPLSFNPVSIKYSRVHHWRKLLSALQLYFISSYLPEYILFLPPFPLFKTGFFPCVYLPRLYAASVHAFLFVILSWPLLYKCCCYGHTQHTHSNTLFLTTVSVIVQIFSIVYVIWSVFALHSLWLVKVSCWALLVFIMTFWFFFLSSCTLPNAAAFWTVVTARPP